MSRRNTLFARISLDYADHPKIAILSAEAFRAHIEMILYSRRYLTDGQIAKQIAKRWPEHVLSELLANDPESPSLTQDDDGNYWLHGYAEMQETRAEVDRKRTIRAEAGRKGGKAKAKARAKAKQTSSKLLSKVPSKNVAETETETETELSTTSEKSADADSRPEENQRDDVERICNHLADRIAANGIKRPNIGKTWRTAARLLIDKDGYTEEQIIWLIDKAQDDEFWRTNILSMPTMRKHADRLKLKYVTPPSTETTNPEENHPDVSPPSGLTDAELDIFYHLPMSQRQAWADAYQQKRGAL